MKTVYKNAVVNGEMTDIVVIDGIIYSIGLSSEDGVDMQGLCVWPGLIDIHTHGCMGIDTMDNRLEEMQKHYAKMGTTSYLATTMTASHDKLVSLTQNIPQNTDGANILGFHLEGPYINEKYKGAQNSDNIQLPDIAKFSELKNIKMITIAPELNGAQEFIKNCGCLVSLGHTDADYETAAAAIDNGACCLTHTFNAMPPLHHRNPGVIGAAIMKNIYIQVICDGIHLHPSVVLMLYKTFGADKMILISDSMRATNLADGTYELGGQAVNVSNKTARLADGTLAGSIATLNDCVKKAIEFGIPEYDAYKMASETPAKLLGIKKGKLETGYDADFIAVDKDKNVVMTVVGGKLQSF